MLFAEIDAGGWAMIIGAVFLGVTQVVKMILDYRREKDKAAKVEEVAVKQEQVVEAQDKKLEALATVADKTHSLVNSAMGKQKELLAITARSKAVITNDPDDIKAADVAEKEDREHKAAQAKVDAKHGVTP